ncbi:MAG: hypothetical protein ACI857_000490 [Arenicella sp.]|jgi:hypothetical protein
MKFLLSLLLLCSISSFAGRHQVLNPIIENVSQKLAVILFTGHEVTEEMRVACHLLYAESLVRSKSTDHLNRTQKLNREKMCDLLHYYAVRGQYPKNYDYPGERAPCFIDKDGTICAVGYLIEQTEGLDIANQINESYQYADIYEMDQDFIEKWAFENGLTIEEVAIIQPTYDWKRPMDKSTHVEFITSLRPAAQLFFGLQLMHFQERWGGKSISLTGYGLSFEMLKDGNFATGLRGTAAFFKRRHIQPLLALNADYFYVNNRGGGINVTPEMGVQSYFRINNLLKFSGHLSYGYHASVINGDNYTPNRHDISLGVGIGVQW